MSSEEVVAEWSEPEAVEVQKTVVVEELKEVLGYLKTAEVQKLAAAGELKEAWKYLKAIEVQKLAEELKEVWEALEAAVGQMKTVGEERLAELVLPKAVEEVLL